MSLSKDDRQKEALKILDDASQAYAHIHDILSQIQLGNYDVKLLDLQQHLLKLSTAEKHFSMIYSARHESYVHGDRRNHIAWFEGKLAEGIRTAMGALHQEAMRGIENAFKAAVLSK